MIEKINWQKELLESGKFNNKFSKNFPLFFLILLELFVKELNL